MEVYFSEQTGYQKSICLFAHFILPLHVNNFLPDKSQEFRCCSLGNTISLTSVNLLWLSCHSCVSNSSPQIPGYSVLIFKISVSAVILFYSGTYHKVLLCGCLVALSLLSKAAVRISKMICVKVL